MPIAVRACTPDDFVRLAAAFGAGRLAHHRARYDLQERGEGWYLLAGDRAEVLGRVTLSFQSKYSGVRTAFGDFPEMNGLEADPPGHGTGTAIIRAAGDAAAARGATTIGLAVGVDNAGAQRLYRRLGYADWGRGRVCDEWTEPDARGTVTAIHRDPCDYLIKELAPRAATRSVLCAYAPNESACLHTERRRRS